MASQAWNFWDALLMSAEASPTGEKPVDLSEELARVRDSLRAGSLVPEHLKLVGGKLPEAKVPLDSSKVQIDLESSSPSPMDKAESEDLTGAEEADDEAYRGALPPPSAEGPIVWLLASGSKYDHLPFVLLAGSLKRRGYRVKVFGVAAFKSCFTDHGIAFEALDQCVALHKGNTKARAWLRDQAERSGRTGDNKEEDILLEIHMLKHETALRYFVRRIIEGKSSSEIQAEMRPTDERFNDFLVRLDCDLDLFVGFMRERFKQVVEWQGQERRMSAENYAPIREERCRVFRAQLRHVADELGCTTIDLYETFMILFAGVVMNLAKSVDKGRDQFVKALLAEYLDLMKWYAGEDVKDYFARQYKKHPGWMNLLHMGKFGILQVGIAMHNLILSMDITPPNLRPNLVLYKYDLASPALALQAKYGVDAVMLWPRTVPLAYSDHLNVYQNLVAEEGKTRLPFTPVKNLGPVAFSNLLRSGRKVVATTPVKLIDEMLPKEWKANLPQLQALMSCHTGEWSLGAAPSFIKPDHPTLFDQTGFSVGKQPGAKEEVMKFLADCKEPPVCFYWGKREHPVGAHLLVLLVAKVLQSIGRRGVLVAGRSPATIEVFREFSASMPEAGLEGLVEYAERHVCFVNAAPHAWLLPQCACLVCHGGDRTTTTALRAGTPMVVVPGVNESFHFGRWISVLGCGKDTQPMIGITEEGLSAALQGIFKDTKLQARCKELSLALQLEPGVTGATEIIARFLREGPLPAPVEPQGYPWPDGTYGIYTKDNQRIVTAQVRGGSVVVEGSQAGWLRPGSFPAENPASLPSGKTHWELQAFWPSVRMCYGVLNADNTALLWEDGTKLVFESSPVGDTLLGTFTPIGLLGDLLESVSKTFLGPAKPV